MNQGWHKQSGFTIIELLIVVVVIAILAAITVVAFNGIQARSQQSKISADLAQLRKAIMAARPAAGDLALRYITLTTSTAGACMAKPAGTDLETLDKNTDGCWTGYKASLQRITDASGINVTGLTDPWGRPYALDENEQENTGTYGPCGLGNDRIGVYLRPMTGSWGYQSSSQIPYITPGC